MATAPTQPGDVLLQVRDLCTAFHTRRGTALAVDGVSFAVRRGQTLCIVGESGCGKSVTALSILRLVSPPGRIDAGQVLFEGRDLRLLPERAMRSVRGARISMIFQEPMTSLNPVFTIGDQIIEAVELHQDVRDEEARERAADMLRRVGIPDPELRLDDYPHQLSGGMKQRAMIAMALVCRPGLLLADEPTTALDVTIQAQILDLIRSLQRDLGMAVISSRIFRRSQRSPTRGQMYAGASSNLSAVRPALQRSIPTPWPSSSPCRRPMPEATA